MDSSLVRLYLLGSTLCTGADGEEITTLPRSPKRLALLSYLAVATPPGFHRRDTLYGLLWPESDQKHARSTLRQTLRQLRGEIGDVVVSRGRGEVGLDWDRFWCDAVQFREELEAGRPERGLELYGRDLLEGFYLKGLGEFERWLDQTRVGLRRQAAEAAWISADNAPDPIEAARLTRWAANLTPYDESAIRRLIEFLDAQGDRTGALREYERFARRIDSEFGTTPSEETAAIARRIASSGESLEVFSPRQTEASESEDPGADSQAAGRQPDPEESTSAGRADVTPTRAASRRRTARKSLAALAVITAIGTLGATLLLSGNWGSDRVGAPIRLTSDPGIETDPVISPDGETVVYSVGPREASALYARSVDADGPARLLTADLPGTHRAPAWSPDGAQIAFITDFGGRSTLQVMSPGGAASPVYEGESFLLVEGPTWSPDARRIGVTIGASVYTVALATKRVTQVASGLRPSGLAWSPDGRWIAYVDGNIDVIDNTGPSSIWVVPAAGGEARRLVALGNSSLNPVWADRGRTLYFLADRDGDFELYRLPLTSEATVAGEFEKVLLDSSSIVGASLSADGRRLAYATYEHRANLWALPIPAEGEPPASVEDGTRVTSGRQVIETVDVSPDGRTLAFDSNLAGNADIYVLSLGGETAPRNLTRSADHDFAPSFSPDGRQIVHYTYIDGIRHLFIADVETGERWTLTDERDPDAHPDWAPSGDQIVFHRRSWATDVGALFVVERESPEAPWSEPRTIREENGEIPSWSPDGRWIAFRTVAAVRIIPAEGGPSRVIWERSGFPRWSTDSQALYVKVFDPPGSGIWKVPLDGGPAELVVADPNQVSIRSEFTVSADRFFYTIAEREADIWIAEVEPSSR